MEQKRTSLMMMLLISILLGVFVLLFPETVMAQESVTDILNTNTALEFRIPEQVNQKQIGKVVQAATLADESVSEKQEATVEETSEELVTQPSEQQTTESTSDTTAVEQVATTPTEESNSNVIYQDNGKIITKHPAGYPTFRWPVSTELDEVTSIFGTSHDYYPIRLAQGRPNDPHLGIDIENGGHGSGYNEIIAPFDGVVSYIDGLYNGFAIVPKEGTEAANAVSQALFVHCSDVFVVPGQQVSEGETMALMGEVGSPGAVHLHYQLFDLAGNEMDPMLFYNFEANYEYDYESDRFDINSERSNLFSEGNIRYVSEEYVAEVEAQQKAKAEEALKTKEVEQTQEQTTEVKVEEAKERETLPEGTSLATKMAYQKGGTLLSENGQTEDVTEAKEDVKQDVAVAKVMEFKLQPQFTNETLNVLEGSNLQTALALQKGKGEFLGVEEESQSKEDTNIETSQEEKKDEEVNSETQNPKDENTLPEGTSVATKLAYEKGGELLSESLPEKAVEEVAVPEIVEQPEVVVEDPSIDPAQCIVPASDAEIKKMCQTVGGEAGGGSFEEKQAVANVIVNRLLIGWDGATSLDEVMEQENQFYAVHHPDYGGGPNPAFENADTSVEGEIYQTVKAALYGNDITDGATSFPKRLEYLYPQLIEQGQGITIEQENEHVFMRPLREGESVDENGFIVK